MPKQAMLVVVAQLLGFALFINFAQARPSKSSQAKADNVGTVCVWLRVAESGSLEFGQVVCDVRGRRMGVWCEAAAPGTLAGLPPGPLVVRARVFGCRDTSDTLHVRAGARDTITVVLHRRVDLKGMIIDTIPSKKPQ